MKKSVVNKVLSLLLILTLFASICGCGAAKIFPIEVSETRVEVEVDEKVKVEIENYDDLKDVVVEIDDRDIAKVKESSGTLIITGLEDGKAKITVTASNSEDEITIKVTVTAPEEPEPEYDSTAAVNMEDWVQNDENITVTEFEEGFYYYEGRMGSTMKTAWFDYSIDAAYYTTDEIGGYSPAEGNELVVVEITIKNTFARTVPMSNWDFDLEWGTGNEEYTYPIEVSEPILENQFPAEYELKVNESRTGTLVYEAPEGTKDFSVGFVEYYENDTEGNAFWVYFTAEEK